MKVYTRTGDKGTTSLVGGCRVSKDDPRIEAYGTVDELMAQTAYLRDSMEGEVDLEEYREDLMRALDHLMRLCSLLACEEDRAGKLPPVKEDHVQFLEERINYMQDTLRPTDKFTLPGGHPLVSLCHICRTVCRRAERRIIAMSRQHLVDEHIIRYINRLSDYFYVLGRKLTDEFNVKEIYWEFDK